MQCTRNWLSKEKHSRWHNWPADGEEPISCMLSSRGPRCQAGLAKSLCKLLDLVQSCSCAPAQCLHSDLLAMAAGVCIFINLDRALDDGGTAHVAGPLGCF